MKSLTNFEPSNISPSNSEDQNSPAVSKILNTTIEYKVTINPKVKTKGVVIKISLKILMIR